jgi:hypothetical protein
METMPPEALLADFPPAIAAIGERLREIVRHALPDATERVRPGWRLIGYDVPVGRRNAYCCFIAPEAEHIHLGFEHGVAMHDPTGVLLGRGITKQVRWLTFRPGATPDPAQLTDLLLESAEVARMTRAERAMRTMDRELSDVPPAGVR